MKFKKATNKDIQQIMDIIEQAKISLKENGIDQWQDGYPNQDTILTDIIQGQSYILEKDNNIIATVMISSQKDPNYTRIEDGCWLQDGSYSVIHRIAINPLYKGRNIASIVIQNAYLLYPNVHSIRADTHEHNIAMQRLLEKNSFQYCGIIYLSDGSKRRAYEKVLR